MSLNLREFLTDLGYADLRVVRGRVCGLTGFDLTTGLAVGLTLAGCQAVYLYENAAEARAALAWWDGVGHPPGPWIRMVGQAGGRRVDLRNPLFAPPVFVRGRRAQA